MDVDDKVSKETSVKKSKKKKSKDVEPMAEDKPTAVTNGDDMEEEPKTEKKMKKKEKKRKLEEEAEHENSQAVAEEANDKSPEERGVTGKGRRKEKEVKDDSRFPILPFISKSGDIAKTPVVTTEAPAMRNGGGGR
ncbi:hypothetical protein LguiB_005832 [Lonicera macranthoides]